MEVVKKQGDARQARARETRRRMIAAAYGLFAEQGYKATTMQAVAGAAGVAVQTVYFTFHTKDELLQAVHEWVVLGDDPAPPPLQDWHRAAMDRPDARDAVPMLVAGTASILARMAPLIPVYHAVAQEPAGAIYRDSEEKRRADIGSLAAALARKTPLRRGMTRRRAAELLYVLMGPDLYRAFVIDAGWTQAEWVRWTGNALVRDLFPERDR